MVYAGRKKKSVPISLSGQMGRMVELIEVEDPFDPGEKIKVIKNVLASPLDHLFSRGRLVGPDDCEADGCARKIAGDWVRAQYERSELSELNAIDYSKVKVDVSFSYSGLSESRVEALQILKRLASAVPNYKIVYEICGREVSIDDYLRKNEPMRFPGRRTKLDAYQELRDGLDSVIEFRGVSFGGGWKMRVARME